MTTNESTALKVAESLLQIKAIVLRPKDPFTWASGWKSPIYCDNRKTLSYPAIRTMIRQEIVTAILDEYGKPDVIAGVATGGIAQGALVAEAMGLPFVYVRSAPKGHGLTNMVEGVINAGQSVVVIEDLISTGGSSLKAVEALRELSCDVKGMVAIFSYGFQVAADNFKQARTRYVALSDYDHLIRKAESTGYITPVEAESLNTWRQAPDRWGV